MTQIADLATRGEIRDDFETAVMQAIVGTGTAGEHQLIEQSRTSGPSLVSLV